MTIQSTVTLGTHNFLPRGSRIQANGSMLATWIDRDHYSGMPLGDFSIQELFYPNPNESYQRLQFVLRMPTLVQVNGIWTTQFALQSKHEFYLPKVASATDLGNLGARSSELIAHALVQNAVQNREASW